MRVKRPNNMAELCSDLVEWRETGLLKGHALRAFARDHFEGDLQAAEHFVTREAIKMIAVPVPYDPYSRIPG